MVKNLFKEKVEYYKASLNTKMGWFDLLIGSGIWGYIILKYGDRLFNFYLNKIPQSLGIFNYYFAYLFFGISLIPLSIFITLTLTTIFNKLFKNGDIVK